MSNDSVVKLIQPGTFNDPLTDVLRAGARALLTQAVEAEVAEFLGKHADLRTEDGVLRVVRHGHLPERQIMTGIGPVAVRQPRVRDRAAGAADLGRIRFTPALLPPYARRSKSLEMLIPLLYLRGVSTGDFEEVLAALLGKDAPGLSASTIGRLKELWIDEHRRWNERDLSARRYVYVWADGIHLQARLEDAAQCILVIIGATLEGRKELLGLIDGTRESAHDWRALLLDLRRRGLSIAPQIAVADGALGFWKALGEAQDPRAALLCAQDRQRPQQAAEKPAAEGQARAAADLDGGNQSRGHDRIRGLHRIRCGQVRQGHRMPGERPRRAARLLRLPGRALEAFADDKPHRKHVRDRAPPNNPIQRLPVEQNCTRLGLQVGRRRAENMEKARWPPPVAKDHPGGEIH